jgi:ABC-type nitrate/sulfonate/bicarbonate transport system ATPase subunit
VSFVELERVAKSFGAAAVLRELSLAVEEGEVLALLGPSGSGKTTLLRLLAGFEEADRGAIRIGGADVTNVPPARRGVGMVFQHYALFPHLDVGENVAFGLAGLDKGEASRRVTEVLALVDLAGFERRAVTRLSGGQQQRVALARALAPAPRLLLLDEPLSNLDPTLRERTRRALSTVLARLGITTVLVTHEQEEAFDLAQRIAVLWPTAGGGSCSRWERRRSSTSGRQPHRRRLRRPRQPSRRPGVARGRGWRVAVADGVAWPASSWRRSTRALAPADAAPRDARLRRHEHARCARRARRGAPLRRGGQPLRVVTERGRELEVLAPSNAARVGDLVAVAPHGAGPPGRIWAAPGETPP